MTSEEFHRILVALSSMASVGVGNEPYISFVRATAIIHSQLHPDDQSKWVYLPDKGCWRHLVEEERKEEESP